MEEGSIIEALAYDRDSSIKHGTSILWRSGRWNRFARAEIEKPL